MDYKPKHSKEEYFNIIIKEKVSEIKKITEGRFKDVGYIKYECFSVVSQHVRGSTPEECLDKVIEASKAKEKRIEEYKSLPTLKDILTSELPIELDRMYYYKEKEEYEDSCHGLSGDIILEIKRIGLKAYRKKQFKEFFNFINNK